MKIYLKPSKINWKKIESINGKEKEQLNFYLAVWLSAKNVTIVIVVMEHLPQNNMVIIYVVGGKSYCHRSRICDNKAVRSDLLENLIWREIKNLLNNNCNLEKEYQRRLDELTKEPDELERNKLNTEEKKLQNSIWGSKRKPQIFPKLPSII